MPLENDSGEDHGEVLAEDLATTRRGPREECCGPRRGPRRGVEVLKNHKF